jgi:hypothetical protein
MLVRMKTLPEKNPGGYFGSKAASGLFQNIIAMMPPHDTYIETHLGGGAVMRRKPSAAHSIGIDIDPKAIADFECDYSVKLVNGCAHEFLSQYDFTGSELLYCDPPYLEETRTGVRRYRFEYTKQKHIELLQLLKTLPCPIILSGYPSALYDELLSDWNTLELQAMTWGGPRTEKLWFNYTIDRVHWSSYAGKNFTDRQRIKRKAEGWGRRYEAMPRAERLAVLAAIMAVESEAFER